MCIVWLLFDKEGSLCRPPPPPVAIFAYIIFHTDCMHSPVVMSCWGWYIDLCIVLIPRPIGLKNPFLNRWCSSSLLPVSTLSDLSGHLSLSPRRHCRPLWLGASGPIGTAITTHNIQTVRLLNKRLSVSSDVQSGVIRTPDVCTGLKYCMLLGQGGNTWNT